MDLKTFLEGVAPYTSKDIEYDKDNVKTWPPTLRLYCNSIDCKGERLFKNSSHNLSIFFREYDSGSKNYHLPYTCKNCGKGSKYYSIVAKKITEKTVTLEKYGEIPPFGTRVPESVLNLFGQGDDRYKFLKGRKSEDQGFGIGAFSYYRRVLDNQKDSLINEIISACTAIGVDDETIKRIKKAKKHKKFTMAIDDIKDLIPNSLFVKSHNPLTALHVALSQGIHDLDDSDCLGIAKDVRTVLTGLVNRIESLKEDQEKMTRSIQNLLDKKNS